MLVAPGDVIAIAALCGQLYSKFHNVREKAPEEFQLLVNEFDQFLGIFQQIDDLERRTLPDQYSLRPYRYWSEVEKTLKKCKAFVDKCKPITEDEWSAGKAWRTLQWPFKKEDVQDLRQELNNHIIKLGMHLQTVSNGLHLEVLDHVQRINSSPSWASSSRPNQASPTPAPYNYGNRLPVNIQGRDFATGALESSSSSRNLLQCYPWDSGIGLGPIDAAVSESVSHGQNTGAQRRSTADTSSHLTAPTFAMPLVKLPAPALSYENHSTTPENISPRTETFPHHQSHAVRSESLSSTCDSCHEPSSRVLSNSQSPIESQHSPSIPPAVWTELGPYTVNFGYTKRENLRAIDEKLICRQCISRASRDPCPCSLWSKETSKSGKMIRGICKRSEEVLLEAAFPYANPPIPHTRHTQMCPSEKLRIFFKDVDDTIRLKVNGHNTKLLPYIELANEADHTSLQEALKGDKLLGSFNVNSFETKTKRDLEKSQTLRVWGDAVSGELKILFWASVDNQRPGRFWEIAASDFTLKQKVTSKSNAVKLQPSKTPGPRGSFSRRSSSFSQSSITSINSANSRPALAELGGDLTIDFDTSEERRRFLRIWEDTYPGTSSR